MREASPYELLIDYMNSEHPGVRYGLSLDGFLIPHKVTTQWGEGEPQTYAGIVIRYKLTGTRLKKRDGSWANKQIAREAEGLEGWARRGYIAQFGAGIDECKQLIDSYLGGATNMQRKNREEKKG